MKPERLSQSPLKKSNSSVNGKKKEDSSSRFIASRNRQTSVERDKNCSNCLLGGLHIFNGRRSLQKIIRKNSVDKDNANCSTTSQSVNENLTTNQNSVS